MVIRRRKPPQSRSTSESRQMWLHVGHRNGQRGFERACHWAATTLVAYFLCLISIGNRKFVSKSPITPVVALASRTDRGPTDRRQKSDFSAHLSKIPLRFCKFQFRPASHLKATHHTTSTLPIPPSLEMLAIRSIRPSTALPRLVPSLTTRLYSTNLPAKPAPPGTLGDPAPESSVGRIIEPFKGGYHSQGTSVARTIRNVWKAGFKRAFWQIKELNDTKAGTLIGTDR
jgi:hypothetical protein